MLRCVRSATLLRVVIEPDFKLLLSWLAGDVGWFFPGVEHSPHAWMFGIGGGGICVVVAASKFSIGAQCDGLSAGARTAAGSQVERLKKDVAAKLLGEDRR